MKKLNLKRQIIIIKMTQIMKKMEKIEAKIVEIRQDETKMETNSNTPKIQKKAAKRTIDGIEMSDITKIRKSK